MHAADVIQTAIDRNDSIACIGLDPRPNLIPTSLIEDACARHGDTAEAVAEAFLAFNRGMLDAMSGHCAAVKPQLACYEAYGSAGMRCLERTVAYARERGIPVIADGKRNDIGSTAEHYAQGYLRSAPGLKGTALPGLCADWLTINAYLGSDGVTPFLQKERTTTGVFVLVKTSNPSSGEIQDLACDGGTVDGGTVMERMAALVARWGAGRTGACGLSDVGAVVGATWPDQAKRLRVAMPDTLFLVPGYGAQGGTAKDALAGARPAGGGVLVNSSRAILAAWQGKGASAGAWKEAARAALDAMNADLNAAR